jgi:hypothetical protein
VLVVVFGAGASFDSDVDRVVQSPTDYHYRPPLAKDLFVQKYGKWVLHYSQCQGLITELRDASPAIEQQLERLTDEAKGRRPLRVQLAAIRYYLQGVISDSTFGWYEHEPSGGVTNYVKLLQRIEAWRAANDESVCFVNFNYDTLLERACVGAGLSLDLRGIDQYVKNDHYWLIRPHGSIDWFYHDEQNPLGEPYMDPIAMAHAAIEAAGDAPPPGPLVRKPNHRGLPPAMHFPAIAIPTATKTDSAYICPDDHLTKLRKALASMSRLLIVGWRGMEQHFYETWRQVDEDAGLPTTQLPAALQQVLIVDSDAAAAQAVANNLRNGRGELGAPIDHAIGGFSKFVSSLRSIPSISDGETESQLAAFLPIPRNSPVLERR